MSISVETAPAYSTSAAKRAQVLSDAVVAAADRLEIRNHELARVLGLSAASVTRLKKAAFRLEPRSVEFQLGTLLVRFYRSLSAILSGDDGSARLWLRSQNSALGAAPIDAIQTVAGLANAVNYVDARRAPL